jgi:arsenite methyltransferase
VVVSNCVLNLVQQGAKKNLFAEIFRVLKNGGRAVISDIVCDEAVPAEMQNDPRLWSGCISGAYREDLFLRAFEEAGFHGIRLVKRDAQPWQTVGGLEFRSVMVEAFKGKQGPCLERNQAVIYRGPFKEVVDDDNHRMERGTRYAVCDKTFNLYSKAPYREHFELIEPHTEVPRDQAKPYSCIANALRDPRETKGQNYIATTPASQCCGTNGPC